MNLRRLLIAFCVAFPALASAGIRLVGISATAYNGTATPSTAIALPTGYAANDVCFLHAVSRDNTTHSITTATGWTIVGTQGNSGTTAHVSLWWKRVAASETAPTVTRTASGTYLVARIMCWRGVDTVDTPFVNSAMNLTATSGTAAMTVATASVTPTARASLILHFVGATNGTNATPSMARVTGVPVSNTIAGAGTQNGGTSTTRVSMTTFASMWLPATATGTATASMNATSQVGAIQVALTPVACTGVCVDTSASWPSSNTFTGTSTSVAMPATSEAGEVLVVVITGNYASGPSLITLGVTETPCGPWQTLGINATTGTTSTLMLGAYCPSTISAGTLTCTSSFALTSGMCSVIAFSNTKNIENSARAYTIRTTASGASTIPITPLGTLGSALIGYFETASSATATAGEYGYSMLVYEHTDATNGDYGQVFLVLEATGGVATTLGENSPSRTFAVIAATELCVLNDPKCSQCINGMMGFWGSCVQ